MSRPKNVNKMDRNIVKAIVRTIKKEVNNRVKNDRNIKKGIADDELKIKITVYDAEETYISAETYIDDEIDETIIDAGVDDIEQMEEIEEKDIERYLVEAKRLLIKDLNNQYITYKAVEDGGVVTI